MHLTSVLYGLIISLVAPRSLWATLSMGAVVIMKSIMVQKRACEMKGFAVPHISIDVDMIFSKGKWTDLFVF